MTETNMNVSCIENWDGYTVFSVQALIPRFETRNAKKRENAAIRGAQHRSCAVGHRNLPSPAPSPSMRLRLPWPAPSPPMHLPSRPPPSLQPRPHPRAPPISLPSIFPPQPRPAILRVQKPGNLPVCERAFVCENAGVPAGVQGREALRRRIPG